ncbi:MAG: tRNA (adenosine(37)-N6)-threonylcarbamoyltransferase complex transferase subunit TsaD [Candidatus Omnitrophica bacterium CG_4_9_14_0_2_um_filter_42_8]|nr:MAG: tRNA (adenosine(37)-N6)-threonylcarbamoyltransferase complex transferase subunit TsaD [Candidatus Omnitrophica bacterium CG22_combo_CG10-13_8_21_14_all_43_16]PJC48274.1 MAG: tRNA (adenosine(37)-N6)-threonylcarbamoyltransferase complex transferase subunit TsaD [Candidatus Omnitrophica bacterium CG_4_9_14_0_2_um_filter_42_8]
MLILGIETSCDETAASVVKDGVNILSNVISSSLSRHKKFGGVVPEIATRHHAENIDKVVNGSLHKAGIGIEEIDAVAVTDGPGLVGALLTGISCAKAISYSLKKPLIAVDHLKAHVYSAIMVKNAPRFPFVGLVISGGHTRLYLVEGFNEFELLGDTVDDAIGEAYDKVSKILGLGYPGGPVIDALAKKGNPNAIKFTCKAVNGTLDFSFSGIKTAVLYYVQGQGKTKKEDICASFQEAVLKVIAENSIKALEKYKIKSFVAGGGVSANSRFREMMQREARYRDFELYFPPLDLCSDNASMVAGLGYRLFKLGAKTALDITARV